MRIGVLALQGAFFEHELRMHELGAEVCEIRQLADWLRFVSDSRDCATGLVLPGGESMVQIRLLRSLRLFDPIREAILCGLPVLGTCAGMILLSAGRLSTMQIEVRRNAYGRQLGSFHALGSVVGVGNDVPMTFIRAPFIEKVMSSECRTLATVDGHIVAAQQQRQLALAFHPELDNDLRLHRYFLSMVAEANTFI